MDTQANDGGPAEALATIEETQRRTGAALRPHPLGLFLPWGLGYVVAFGSVWLAIDGVLPSAAAAVLVAAAAAGAVSVSTITLARAARGIAGPSRRVGAMYGWAWFLGFAAIAVTNNAIAGTGVPDDTMSLIWSSSSLTVVGVLYLAGGALFDSVVQYALGVWILCSAAVAVLVGYPSNFLVLALAGGGGFVALAVAGHARWCR